MLNELLLIERGLTQHGLSLAESHPDVKEIGQDAPLRVRLAAGGTIARIETTEKGQVRWTLRDGQHNSFPYVKIGRPLLSPIDDKVAEAETWKKFKDARAQRAELLRLLDNHPIDISWAGSWPAPGLRKRIRERLDQLASLRNGDSAAVPAVFERFLAALDRSTPFLVDLLAHLKKTLANEDETWISPVRKLTIEGGTLYFDVDDRDFDRDVGDPDNIGPMSLALSGEHTGGEPGLCSLTGATVQLHEGNFPQPNLPSLGQTYLFAKNKEIPAAHRYDRFAAAAFVVGADILKRLSGGLLAVTADERKGKTWRLIPSEKPKQSDLLLAFLPADLNLPVASVLAEAGTPEMAQAAYQALSERALADLDGRVRHAEAQEEVQLCVIRKLDPANRKAILHRLVSVTRLHECALRWRSAIANHPPIKISIPVGKGQKAVRAEPPHIEPTSLPALTRKYFVDGGTRQAELTGITSAEAFALFLEEGDLERRAHSILRLVLRRHGPLLAGAARALRNGFDEAKAFDLSAALQSVTLIGILLDKLGRRTEEYMDDAAFKLGQLLAVADTVHVGYCADQRGGDVPPVLLGNSVLSMAQSKPTKALSVLCGRWKPYGAWAKRVDAARKRATTLEKQGEKGRAYTIRKALSQASRISKLCAELSGVVPEFPPPNTANAFRAELLLGYLAGLPSKDEDASPLTTTEATGLK
jgi:hypothetical protein